MSNQRAGHAQRMPMNWIRSCAIKNGVQDPASIHLDPRQSANTQTGRVAVSVVVPAQDLQTQPLTVHRASDIALSNAMALESYSKKALLFRHPLGKSLSFECCRVHAQTKTITGLLI